MSLPILFILSVLQSPTLEASSLLPKGWMRGGWGSYRLKVKAPGKFRVLRWSANWQGSKGAPWGGTVDAEATDEWTKEEVGYFPPELIKDGKLTMDGTVTIVQDGKESALNFRIAIPEAKLPEPLKTIKGKTVGIALQESRFKNFKTSERALDWIDRCYQSMIDLTGEKPFGGRLMVFKEAPAHPYWAYAGEEMILNTDFVAKTVEDFDKGLISFGWVHEVGHNFDTLGDWYIWNGAAGEFQANFKLCHALESLGEGVRINWKNGTTLYAPGATERPIPPSQLIDSFFMPHGDKYLADPSRTWDSMSSDEMHAFFMRIQKAYGWEPFKAMYRTYRRLADEGKKPPEKPEERVGLMLAILQKETKTDLKPAAKLWRFPTDNWTEMLSKYGISEG